MEGGELFSRNKEDDSHSLISDFLFTLLAANT